MLNLFCGTPLTAQQVQEQEHHTSSRSFLLKFEAHSSISAGVSTLTGKQGLELSLMTQQFYKCLGCVEEESGVLTRPHEQSKPQPLGNAVNSKKKFLTSFYFKLLKQSLD